MSIDYYLDDFEKWYEENSQRFGLGNYKACERVWKAAREIKLESQQPVDITLGDPECKKCSGNGYTSEGTPNMYECGSHRTAALCECAIERMSDYPASLSKEAQTEF